MKHQPAERIMARVRTRTRAVNPYSHTGVALSLPFEVFPSARGYQHRVSIIDVASLDVAGYFQYARVVLITPRAVSLHRKRSGDQNVILLYHLNVSRPRKNDDGNGSE
jgi:hypothetical protein